MHPGVILILIELHKGMPLYVILKIADNNNNDSNIVMMMISMTNIKNYYDNTE